MAFGDDAMNAVQIHAPNYPVSYRWLLPFACVAICELVGLAGTWSMKSEATWHWYGSLNFPSIAPPNWIFGPVWMILYALMGWAWARILVAEMAGWKKIAIVLFAVQLTLNGMWTPSFFGRQSIAAGLAVILLLCPLVWAMFWIFNKIDRPAGWMTLPYALWVSFAMVLNFWFWVINR